MIFLGYKLIEPGLGIEEDGFDWQLGTVVGVKVEFGRACERKGESAKGTRDCGGGGSQTGLSQELPTVGVKELAVSRFRRLLVSTQTNLLREVLWLRN